MTHHRKAGRQLRRTSEQRLALMRNLAISLIEHGAIETTEAKAKELRPFVEKLITKAKRGHAARASAGGARTCTSGGRPTRCSRKSGPAFATRAGGYTRILRTGHRKGDGADMARIELIGIVTADGSKAASRPVPRHAAKKKPKAAKAASKTARRKGRAKS